MEKIKSVDSLKFNIVTTGETDMNPSTKAAIIMD